VNPPLTFIKRKQTVDLVKQLGYRRLERKEFARPHAGYELRIEFDNRPGPTRLGGAILSDSFSQEISRIHTGKRSPAAPCSIIGVNPNQKPLSQLCFVVPGYRKSIVHGVYSDDSLDEALEDIRLLDTFLATNATPEGIQSLLELQYEFNPMLWFRYAIFLVTVGDLGRASELLCCHPDQLVAQRSFGGEYGTWFDSWLDETFPPTLDPRIPNRVR
jgi:hypothetical protein